MTESKAVTFESEIKRRFPEPYASLAILRKEDWLKEGVGMEGCINYSDKRFLYHFTKYVGTPEGPKFWDDLGEGKRPAMPKESWMDLLHKNPPCRAIAEVHFFHTMPTIINLKTCPRCGESHPKSLIKVLTRPYLSFKRWGMCPKLKEPFLVSLSRDK
jgi:hypothetical protein